MATNKYFYLDKVGLAQYDALIKQYVDDADALSIKYLTFEPSGNTGTNPTTIKFWKVDPTETGATPAYTVTLPDASTLMTKVASGTTGHVVTLDSTGQVVDAGVALTDLLKKSSDSGATFTTGQWAVFDSSGDVKGLNATAANVAFDDTTAQTGSNTVQGAIESIAAATGGGVAAKTVYITETSGSSSDPYSKRYGIYQGGTGSASSPVPAEKLADIDIPKDMVVESGSVVEIFFDSSDNTLHEGSISGPDVTVAIKGQGVTPTAADAGKYVKLVIANAASTAIYIKATDFVDIYTGGSSTYIDVTIDGSNVITATLNATAVSLLTKADTAIQPDVIAPTFSTSATYALGDYVMYNGKLYECTTAVTTAGAWVAGSWTESKVMTSFQPIPSNYIAGLFA